MQLIDSVRVVLLKKRARALLRAIHEHQDRLDCGNALASYLDPEIHRMKNDFNATMDALAAIDPDTPKNRL